MKKNPDARLSRRMFLAALPFLHACGGGGGGSSPTEEPQSVIAPPEGFGFVSGRIFECTAPGRARHDFDAEAMFLSKFGAHGSTLWVSPDGSDAANGAQSAPMRTVGAAVAAGAGVVMMKPGEYFDRFDIRSAVPVRIKAAGQVIVRAAEGMPATAAGVSLFLRGSSHYFAGARVYLDGISFRTDNGLEVHDSALYARHCSFDMLGYHNVEVIQSSTLFQECSSTRSLNGDGFNYYGGEAVEVDCICRDNGLPDFDRFDGENNKQGSSIHYGTKILRVNGIYGGNYGQSIADTGVDSRVWIVGSVIEAPKTPIWPLWMEGTAVLDTVAAASLPPLPDIWVENGTTTLRNVSAQTAGPGAVVRG